ncbi:MAG: phosphatase PAP2 family protein [Candidatus Methanoperedens sp.]|nr:phosphatase PAP2 family protein [Candidatus Methanoperedens sp.]
MELIQFLFNDNINIYFHNIENPILDIFFKILTDLGSEPVYILIASLIFWCYDRKMGIRALYVILFSAYIALLAKTLFAMPRPPEYLHKVTENEFGFPSGHALVSSGFWGYISIRFKKNWIIIVGIIAVVLVSLSRIYLGVHYPGDVIGGIVFGLIVAFVFSKGETGIASIISRQDLITKYLIALFFPILLVFIASLTGDLAKEQIELGLVMVSMWTGSIQEEENIRFRDTRNRKHLIRRAFTGIFVMGSIFVVFEILSLINPAFNYIKYVLLGFSLVYVVPFIFTKLEIIDENK